jgi:hypothetical protein
MGSERILEAAEADADRITEARTVGPVLEHEGVVGEEVEDERAYVDLVLEGCRPREVLGADATDVEDRTGIHPDLFDGDVEVLAGVEAGEEDPKEPVALERGRLGRCCDHARSASSPKLCDFRGVGHCTGSWAGTGS